MMWNYVESLKLMQVLQKYDRWSWPDSPHAVKRLWCLPCTTNSITMASWAIAYSKGITSKDGIWTYCSCKVRCSWCNLQALSFTLLESTDLPLNGTRIWKGRCWVCVTATVFRIPWWTVQMYMDLRSEECSQSLAHVFKLPLDSNANCKSKSYRTTWVV